MTNPEQAMNIYHLLRQVVQSGIEGDVVELGCNDGRTAMIIQKTLDQLGSKKELHVYDSFEGMPEKTSYDGNKLQPGELKTTENKLKFNFQKFSVKEPVIHKGWFKDTLPSGLPAALCFAHLDGDFYSSIKESLEHVYPKLSKGAVVVVDDYCDPEILDVFNILPGVKKACDEFFKDKTEKMNVVIAGDYCHGYFIKS
jgi:O-methyltransferase